jgi:hypothetical protein
MGWEQAQPIQGWNLWNIATLGSASVATQGFVAKSLWDWEAAVAHLSGCFGIPLGSENGGCFPDPNGVTPQSPRLRGTSYLGETPLTTSRG